jgi:hypothetical protein
VHFALEKMMVINWEPSEFDKTFVVSGTLSVATASGERVLGYPQSVSVSASDPQSAKAKVRAMLLSREGASEAEIKQDQLIVLPQTD